MNASQNVDSFYTFALGFRYLRVMCLCQVFILCFGISSYAASCDSSQSKEKLRNHLLSDDNYFLRGVISNKIAEMSVGSLILGKNVDKDEFFRLMFSDGFGSASTVQFSHFRGSKTSRSDSGTSCEVYVKISASSSALKGIYGGDVAYYVSDTSDGSVLVIEGKKYFIESAFKFDFWPSLVLEEFSSRLSSSLNSSFGTSLSSSNWAGAGLLLCGLLFLSFHFWKLRAASGGGWTNVGNLSSFKGGGDRSVRMAGSDISACQWVADAIQPFQNETRWRCSACRGIGTGTKDQMPSECQRDARRDAKR